MPDLSKFITKFSSRGLEKLIELSKAVKGMLRLAILSGMNIENLPNSIRFLTLYS